MRVLVAVCGLALVVASGAFALFWGRNISLRAASPPVEHRFWCPEAQQFRFPGST